jgi:hypothetical protein
MKKSLLNEQDVNKIIERVDKLTSEAGNQWGKMTSTEMLLHCTLANTFILEDQSDYQKPTLKQRVIKLVLFHFISRIPKNNVGPKRLEVQGKIDNSQFEDQRQKYIQTIKKFPGHQKPFRSIHPRAGFLNQGEWGIFAWMHMDHHLRQFGV